MNLSRHTKLHYCVNMSHLVHSSTITGHSQRHGRLSNCIMATKVVPLTFSAFVGGETMAGDDAFGGTLARGRHYNHDRFHHHEAIGTSCQLISL
jgi:hypothetical protein